MASSSRWIRWGIVAVVVGAVVVGMLGDDDASSSEAASTEHLVDRLWIERMPDGSRDMVGKLAVIRSLDHGRFGVTERGSVWRHRSEVFQWRLEGTALHTAWPQDEVRASFEVKTWSCEDEAPEPFELCLEIRANRDAVKLYSRYDWVIRPRTGGDDLVEDPIVRRWMAELAPVFELSGTALESDEAAAWPALERPML